MTLSYCNIFIYFLYLTTPKIGILLVYIQSSTFDKKYRKIERIFSFLYLLLTSSFYNIIFIYRKTKKKIHSHIFCSYLHFTILYLIHNINKYQK